MKLNKMIGYLLATVLTFSTFVGNIYANDSEVTTRDLAMLASLVYEPVPNNANYDLTYATKNNKKLDNSCIKTDGSLVPGCFYTAYEDTTDKKYFTKNKDTNDMILPYVEGMSARKAKGASLVSTLTSNFQEDGERYLLLNFAHTSEMVEKGWSIVDYASEEVKGTFKEWVRKYWPNSTDVEGIFDAVTFKLDTGKDKNKKTGFDYVIAYRGTDFPDLMEWVDDVLFAFNGEHSEAVLAYEYAQETYNKIIKTDPDAKFYVTGHSLGAYLAQIGGAAIVELESEKNVKSGNYDDLNAYTTAFKPSINRPSRLIQVAYFNGMGAGGLVGPDSDLVDRSQDALVYLSTHNRDGSVANSGRRLTYTNSTNSSGRLVLYSMDQDPISNVGLHLGEILKLKTAADALTNHRDKHSSDITDMFEYFEKLTSSENKEAQNFWDKLFGKKAKEKSFSEKIAEFLLAIDDMKIIDYDMEKALKDFGTQENFPKFVTNKIQETYGVTPTTLSLGSVITNIFSGGLRYNDEYGLLNKGVTNGLLGVVDHFNVNHETDSFVCIDDVNGSGVIDNINLTVKGGNSNFSCENGKCYKKGYLTIYNDESFESKASVKTNTADFIGSNIYLEATIDGACARKYIWEYSNNNGATWQKMGETTDNRFIIPKNKITEDGKQYSFRVSATYGDSFQSVNTKFDNSNKATLEYSTIYSANPTINEGLTPTQISSTDSNYAIKTSNVLKVSLDSDTKKPSCNVESSVTIKINCKLLSCTAKTVNKALTCTDSSGIREMKINEFKVEQGGLTLTPIISASKGNISNGVFNFSITGKRKPSWNKPYIKIEGYAVDNAGNKTTFNKKVNVTVTK